MSSLSSANRACFLRKYTPLIGGRHFAVLQFAPVERGRSRIGRNKSIAYRNREPGALAESVSEYRILNIDIGNHFRSPVSRSRIIFLTAEYRIRNKFRSSIHRTTVRSASTLLHSFTPRYVTNIVLPFAYVRIRRTIRRRPGNFVSACPPSCARLNRRRYTSNSRTVRFPSDIQITLSTFMDDSVIFHQYLTLFIKNVGTFSNVRRTCVMFFYRSRYYFCSTVLSARESVCSTIFHSERDLKTPSTILESGARTKASALLYGCFFLIPRIFNNAPYGLDHRLDKYTRGNRSRKSF